MGKRLEGKIAIITGAGKGIGKATALLFANEDAKVLVVDIDKTAAINTVDTITKTGGVSSACIADVSKREDVEFMAKTAIERYERIDILISNAGIYSFARIEELSEEEWDRIYAVNLKGTFLTVQACLKEMQKQKYGKIVMTSSITGPITANLGMSHYGTTKAGIIGFMRAAALENATYNITVNAVMPGNIMTEGASTIEEEFIRAQERAIPMGRWGKPEEVAYAMLFLASDESQYITGQTLIIDGGQIIRESNFGLGSDLKI